jgi:hypothetical protein
MTEVNRPIPPTQEQLDIITCRYTIIPEEGTLVDQKGVSRGYIHTKGYKVIDIDCHGRKRTFALHHIMWWKHYGEWPTQELDHKDRNKGNPRIDNLVLSNRRDNMSNGAPRSVPTGVVLMTQRPYSSRPYKAQISINNVPTFLGYFATAEAASRAYQDAKARLKPTIQTEPMPKFKVNPQPKGKRSRLYSRYHRSGSKYYGLKTLGQWEWTFIPYNTTSEQNSIYVMISKEKKITGKNYRTLRFPEIACTLVLRTR